MEVQRFVSGAAGEDETEGRNPEQRQDAMQQAADRAIIGDLEKWGIHPSS